MSETLNPATNEDLVRIPPPDGLSTTIKPEATVPEIVEDAMEYPRVPKEQLEYITVCSWCGPKTWPSLGPNQNHRPGICLACYEKAANKYPKNSMKHKSLMKGLKELQAQRGIAPTNHSIEPRKGGRRIGVIIRSVIAQGSTGIKTILGYPTQSSRTTPA